VRIPKALLLLSGWLLCLPAIAGAQTREAPAHVEPHVRAYLAAVNEGEAAALAFRNDHVAEAFAADVPERPFLGYFATQRRVTGGVELVEWRSAGDDAVDLLLTDRIYGARHGLHLGFDPAAENRIAVFEPGPEPEWAVRNGPGLSAPDVGARTLDLLRRGCAAGVFSGAVLVARGDEVLSTGACGEANRRYGVPNTARTRFNLGSMNKMFTAVAVMQLVEAGRVRLDDPLSLYADESWLPAAISGKITVRHLLTHTSGLGNFLSETFENSSRLRFREVEDFKSLIAESSLAFEPGTGFRYSNSGMLLLGHVIEAASGDSYFDYVREHIFEPAGMSDTDSWPMDEPQPDLAIGYAWAPDGPFGWRENTFEHVFRGTPAGGGYSTVGDLHRFARALETDTLISAGSRSWLWTDQPPNDYGGGFMIRVSSAGRIVGHDGVFPGISSRLDIYIDKDYVVVVLGNQDAASAGLGSAIRGLIAETR